MVYEEEEEEEEGIQRVAAERRGRDGWRGRTSDCEGTVGRKDGPYSRWQGMGSDDMEALNERQGERDVEEGGSRQWRDGSAQMSGTWFGAAEMSAAHNAVRMGGVECEGVQVPNEARLGDDLTVRFALWNKMPYV